jgi:hypothetical protein
MSVDLMVLLLNEEHKIQKKLARAWNTTSAR